MGCATLLAQRGGSAGCLVACFMGGDGTVHTRPACCGFLIPAPSVAHRPAASATWGGKSWRCRACRFWRPPPVTASPTSSFSTWEDLGEAGATAQCGLQELWLCGHLPECVMVGLKHLGHGVLRRDGLLPLLRLFDRHPHLQFIHCCTSPDLAHPAGGSPDCSPAAAPPSWLTAAGSPSSCCCRLS